MAKTSQLQQEKSPIQGTVTTSNISSICCISAIPKGEAANCSGYIVGWSTSISIARETSRKVSPKRRRGASMVRSLKTEESFFSSSFKMDNVFLKDLEEWNSAGRYTSLLLHEAQDG
jgi:hypothetical protein